MPCVGQARFGQRLHQPSVQPTACPALTPPLRSGRLFNQIRSRDGLAYSVSGGWSSLPIDHPGLFVASAETAQPAALLAALRAALEDAGAAPPPADELASAKQETLNQFVFNFASRPAQLARIATFDLLGIPQDYLFK